jgi:hypothetical protein
MTRQFHILVIGIILLFIGGLIRYKISKRRFNRRNPFGLQQYRSYDESLITRTGEGCVAAIGAVFILAGILLCLVGFG